MIELRKPPTQPVIIIPARMASTRLPNKPLADVQGEPMIVHVWRRAQESAIGAVIVACDGPEIADVISKVGGQAVLTDPNHPSGSDRIFEALQTIDRDEKFDSILNLQGDLPTISPGAIKAAWDLLKNPLVDIGTLAVEIRSEKEKHASQVVKAAIDLDLDQRKGRALYFSRTAVPSGEGPFYHHIGIYSYRRSALQTFVAAKPTPLEQREKLEQLRALALGLRIEVALINDSPLGVDTAEDLEAARAILVSKV